MASGSSSSAGEEKRHTTRSDLRFRSSDLVDFTQATFIAEGMLSDHAQIVARSLVLANLRGLDTHGVVRIPAYLKRIKAGLINLRPDIDASSPRAFSTVVDGDNAMGAVVANMCMKRCISSARQTGIGIATARHSNHFGAASVYTVPAAERGFIAIAMSPGAKTLAPFGSRAPLLGTNPFAFAAPAGKYASWSLDMAASVAARGHIRLAAQAGEPIPSGWALDADGKPTNDPHAALNGILLPFGGAKGSAFAMMVDILAGVLAGSGFAGDIRDWNSDFGGPANVGHFFMVLAVDALMPRQEFEARMETAIARLKALTPAEGFAEVLYPGERGARVRAEREETGIPLSSRVVELLRGVAEENDLHFPDALTSDASDEIR